MLDNELAAAFLGYSLNEKRNSPSWMAKQEGELAWWMERLGTLNLRRLSLRDHVIPAVEGAPNRHHKITTIKALFSWLRKHKHVLTSAEDCTIDRPRHPTGAASAVEALEGDPSSTSSSCSRTSVPARGATALTVQAGTGWHTTEVIRFATAGSIEPLPRSAMQDGVAGVLVLPNTRARS